MLDDKCDEILSKAVTHLFKCGLDDVTLSGDELTLAMTHTVKELQEWLENDGKSMKNTNEMMSSDLE